MISLISPEEKILRPILYQESASFQGFNLKGIHETLAHPGVRRMLHFVKAKSLPFSTDDVRGVCRNCIDCARLTPRYHTSPNDDTLIKALHAWDRISVDFKGPVAGKRPYLLVGRIQQISVRISLC